jgi:hypothetical protein
MKPARHSYLQPGKGSQPLNEPQNGGSSLLRMIDLKAEEWNGFLHSLWEFNIERIDIVRAVANMVVDRMIVPQE